MYHTSNDNYNIEQQLSSFRPYT